MNNILAKGTKANKIVSVIVFILLVVTLASCFSSGEEKKIDFKKFNKDLQADYITAAESYGKEHLNVSFPGVNDWQIADFDNKDDGLVICYCKVTVTGYIKKLTYTCVLELIAEDKYKMHYMALANKLYFDDGTCSEIMKKMGYPTNK